MNHNDLVCQYSIKNDPNTPKFWDNKIVKNKSCIQKSPIYMLKNSYIINRLKYMSGNFLDVGIGYGFLESEILNKKLNLNLFGIDISSVAVTNAIKNLSGEFKKASILSIPYNNNYFNCVVALDVIEHLSVENGKKSVKEIYRVTKKNGLVIISVPTNEKYSDRSKNGHLVGYDVKSVSSLLVDSGFTIEKIKLLTAFRKLTYIKNLINDLLRIRKPNLIIVFATKR
ncbi:MAG: class I SAM-dependent methyltransferase [Microgenomates group bacterium]